MKAKRPAAEAFQAKVADEIIPAIRKHGLYATPDTVNASF
nr:MAG TPA: antirepressor [Bacteriophage sp.]